MEYLNKQIEALSKKKSRSLVRKQISCGLFQELEDSEKTQLNLKKKTNRKFVL